MHPAISYCFLQQERRFLKTYVRLVFNALLRKLVSTFMDDK